MAPPRAGTNTMADYARKPTDHRLWLKERKRRLSLCKNDNVPEFPAGWLGGDADATAGDSVDCGPVFSKGGVFGTYDQLYPASLAAHADKLLCWMLYLVYKTPQPPDTNVFHYLHVISTARDNGLLGGPRSKGEESITLMMCKIHRRLLSGDFEIKIRQVPSEHVCDGCCCNKGAAAQKYLYAWPPFLQLPVLHSETRPPCTANVMRPKIESFRTTLNAGIVLKEDAPDSFISLTRAVACTLEAEFRTLFGRLRTIFLVSKKGEYCTRMDRVSCAIKDGDGATLAALVTERANFRFVDHMLQASPPDLYEEPEKDYVGAAPGSYSGEHFVPTLVTLAVSYGRQCFVDLLVRSGARLVYDNISLYLQFPGCHTITPAVMATCLVLCREDALKKYDILAERRDNGGGIIPPALSPCAIHTELTVFGRLFLISPSSDIVCPGVFHQRILSPVADVIAFYTEIIARRAYLAHTSCIPSARAVLQAATERRDAEPPLPAPEIIEDLLDFEDVDMTFPDEQ